MLLQGHCMLQNCCKVANVIVQSLMHNHKMRLPLTHLNNMGNVGLLTMWALATKQHIQQTWQHGDNIQDICELVMTVKLTLPHSLSVIFWCWFCTAAKLILRRSGRAVTVTGTSVRQSSQQPQKQWQNL